MHHSHNAAARITVSFLVVASLFLSTGSSSAVPPSRTDLTLQDRVRAQRAIEEVYSKHRIWPAENPGAKPPLEAVLSEAQLRAKVEDSLRKSNAAEMVWGRPITAPQLQAEMERMAQRSRAPEVLQEVFAALGDDPRLIAETLVRQTLVDRLVRNWYSRDERFHGVTRRKAEAALARVTDASQLRNDSTSLPDSSAGWRRRWKRMKARTQCT